MRGGDSNHLSSAKPCGVPLVPPRLREFYKGLAPGRPYELPTRKTSLRHDNDVDRDTRLAEQHRHTDEPLSHLHWF